MAVYNLFFKDSVRKDLDSIPKNDLRRIIEGIESLAANPRPLGCEKLSGQEKYRLRQGNYRIIYSIQDTQLTVWVVKVGHRREVYRG
ncbi:type II toxin-antitoxin system RelE family toxin [Thiovibrio frasassiensis]|uniref:Type II toxin-antitoxin system RelE/ParE family toxin n=1 Tax=Thiovibrio frasassiensis TaxID=2984131 RepID=A0A9X4MIF8_9BACT|nr:type II toxin-antitoxin system RelE/ParE family toxin [Thiovibrio frasassiensis]MDG4476958.1 type II toxin-antitoxin system RelE/ParE family toxin [Thiovibrio frasassiensis]